MENVQRWQGRSMAVAATAVAVSLVAFPGTALAAGSPYGGAPPVLQAGVPGGLRNVVTAFSVANSGKIVQGKVGHVRLRLIIKRGTAPSGEQVVITRDDLSLITPRKYKRVPKHVQHDRALFALSVFLIKNGREIRDRKFITLDLAGKQFSRADYVVVYSPKAHGFMPAPKNHARVVNGHVVVRFLAGTEFAVLGK